MTPKITIDVQIDEDTTLVIEREYPVRDQIVLRDASGGEVKRLPRSPGVSANQVTMLASAAAAALADGGLR